MGVLFLALFVFFCTRFLFDYYHVCTFYKLLLGVKSKTNDTAVTEKLCQLCKNPSVCSDEDGYAGHDGAFKCMAGGAGEVAFVKQNTTASVIAENATKYGVLGDYRLLCKDESKKGKL